VATAARVQQPAMPVVGFVNGRSLRIVCSSVGRELTSPVLVYE
jgi:hypothetical protein